MGRRDTNAPLLLALLLCLSCSATRSVRPVGKGRMSTALSVGGPLFVNLGPPLPVPLPVLSARYGVTNRTDVDVGIILPIVPTLALDAGAATLVLTPTRLRPAIMAGGRVTVVGALPGYGAARVLLEAHSTASWNLSTRLLGYGGADVLVETRRGGVQPTAILGVSYAVPSSGLTLSAEGRWLAIAKPSSDLSVRYVSFFGHGAAGVMMAVSYTFDVQRKPL